jgi:hypothetical protein
LQDDYTIEILLVRKPCGKAGVDCASGLSVNEDVHDISRDDDGDIGRCLERSGREMRREGDTRSAKGRVRRKGFLPKGVEGCACYSFLRDRPAKGFFIYESASRGIHDIGTLLHQADPAAVHNLFGFVRERQGKDQEVGPAENMIQLFGEHNVMAFGPWPVRGLIVSEDLHFET